MVRVVLKDEYRVKKQEKSEERVDKTKVLKTAVTVAGTVLTAVEMMSTPKGSKVARLMKEILDIFTKK